MSKCNLCGQDTSDPKTIGCYMEIIIMKVVM